MSAALIAKLIEAGTPAVLVAEVAMELGRAQAAAEILEQRRKNERDRKARSRDVTGQDVTGRESQDNPSPQSPPLKSTPDPLKITPPLTPQPIVEGARPKFSPPDGVTDGQWKAFRQQRKKALNDRSYTLLCNKLTELADAGWPPGQMIDLAIERGWETVFEPRDQSNGSQAKHSLRGPRADPTLELVRAATAAQREDRRDHGEARLALPASKLG